jgi:hypothetical protein
VADAYKGLTVKLRDKNHRNSLVSLTPLEVLFYFYLIEFKYHCIAAAQDFTIH